VADDQSIVLLDGATGTELAVRGVDVTPSMWSAVAMRESPDVLQQVHADYLHAGAQAIIANTFRTHERSLARAGLGGDAAALTAEAVRIARAARDAVNPQALVFGSVAPLEDCYQPELAPSAEACQREHAMQMKHLLEAGVDRILIETMNNQQEAQSAARAAQELAPGAWMISFCTTSEGPPGVLLSGEPMTDLLPQLHDAIAVGVNCVAAPAVSGQVKLLRALLPEGVRVMAYANVGHADAAGNWIESDAVSPQRYAEYAMSWLDGGATIIGGCCGTTPATIAAVKAALDGQHE